MNRKAIVTGASRGIGRGIAYKLASLGYDVAISYNSMEEEAKEVAQTIGEKYGTRCFYYQASLNEDGAGEALFERAVADLGGLDLLVNNAGRTMMGGILDISKEKLDFLVNLDFRNCMVMMQCAARYMVTHGIRGNIINITSSRGERAYPKDATYGGLKAALNRAIQSMALELGPHGIRVNNVAPGMIKVRERREVEEMGGQPEKQEQFFRTVGNMIPLGTYGTPEDIANAVAFLASDEASYITGYTLRVDGGLILPGMPEDPAAEQNVVGWSRPPQRRNRENTGRTNDDES